MYLWRQRRQRHHQLHGHAQQQRQQFVVVFVLASVGHLSFSPELKSRRATGEATRRNTHTHRERAREARSHKPLFGKRRECISGPIRARGFRHKLHTKLFSCSTLGKRFPLCRIQELCVRVKEQSVRCCLERSRDTASKIKKAPKSWLCHHTGKHKLFVCVRSSVHKSCFGRMSFHLALLEPTQPVPRAGRRSPGLGWVRTNR